YVVSTLTILYVVYISYIFLVCLCLFFFFQAEDGIRDRNVTGVQTCALPISIISLGAVQSKALDGTKTYDGYYESYATGYLCDEHNYYITPSYADEGWYIEKTAFEDNRQAEGEQLDTTTYSANYHLHRDNVLAESQDQVMKGNVELSKHVSSTGSSDGIDLEGAGFTFYLISDLSKEEQSAQSRSGKIGRASCREGVEMT